MVNIIHINDSLITLCKNNHNLRYVTVKQGPNNSEIYIFKYKKNEINKAFINDFWCGFVTLDETVIILGSETSRRTINNAYCTVYFEQEKVVNLNSPNLFIIGIKGNPAKTYQLDKIFVNIKK